jgi:hypothetical protein
VRLLLVPWALLSNLVRLQLAQLALLRSRQPHTVLDTNTSPAASAAAAGGCASSNSSSCRGGGAAQVLRLAARLLGVAGGPHSEEAVRVELLPGVLLLTAPAPLAQVRLWYHLAI